LPRDSSQTLALLVFRALLSAERDDHATGRPLVNWPTPRLLQVPGVMTLEEGRTSLSGLTHHVGLNGDCGPTCEPTSRD
jgi:hypothetical protein